MFSISRQRCRNTKHPNSAAAATTPLPAHHQKNSSAGADAKYSVNRPSLGEQGLHVDVLLLLGAELEEVARVEAEHAGDDDVGELLDADVVAVDRLVVELAPVGDRVLQPGDAAEQRLDRLVGLQLGVGLGRGED